MPTSPESQHPPITDPDHLLPPHKKEVGPTIGIIIILLILICGAIYLWSTRYHKSAAATSALPYIPAGTTTLPEVNE